MKTISELNSSKVPLVIIDKRLDNIVLFPDKAAKANQIMAKSGLPKKSRHSR